MRNCGNLRFVTLASQDRMPFCWRAGRHLGRGWLGVAVKSCPRMSGFPKPMPFAPTSDAKAYRVSFHTDLTAPAFAAVARHELEHHLQYDRFGFDSVMIQHKRALATFAPADRVPGNGVLYNQIPMEADANAAGARFLLTLVDPAELGRLAGDDPSLSMFLDSAAPLMETLPERMERFINEDGPKLTEEFLRGRRA